MIKKVFKLIFISIISILLISCTGDLFNPKPKYDLEVLVMKKDYLPITVKLLDSSNEETIGSVTTSDQDENGNYKATFKVEPDDYGSYYKINIYKNNTILIHTESISSLKENEVTQLKIY